MIRIVFLLSFVPVLWCCQGAPWQKTPADLLSNYESKGLKALDSIGSSAQQTHDKLVSLVESGSQEEVQEAFQKPYLKLHNKIVEEGKNLNKLYEELKAVLPAEASKGLEEVHLDLLRGFEILRTADYPAKETETLKRKFKKGCEELQIGESAP